MTRIYVQNVKPRSGISSVSRYDTVAANGSPQWLDKYGIIKTSEQIIAGTGLIISSSTNALTTGTVKVSTGCTVTVRGNWRVL